MFGLWLDRSDRELRLQKSKIYKEMLDNQILLNQKYRQKQEQKVNATNRSHEYTEKRRVPQVKRLQAQDHIAVEQWQNKKQKRRELLPILSDKQTLYEGSSSFIATPNNPQRRLNLRDRIKTEQIAEHMLQASQTSNEDIEEILSQLKSLNKGVVKSQQQRKHKRLSNLGAFTRRLPKDRDLTMDINHLTQPQNAEEETVPPQTATKRPNCSPSPTSQIRNRSLASHNIEDFMRKNARQRKQSLTPSIKNNKKDISTVRTVVERRRLVDSTQKTSGTQDSNNPLLEKERERFIQILKKVKNRGQCLYIKLSKFPKEAKQ